MAKSKAKIGVAPEPTGIKKLTNKEVAAYLDMYHLLLAGWDMINAYYGICESEVAPKMLDRVNYVYSWLQKLFINLRMSEPSVKDFGRWCVFNRFEMLTGQRKEDIEDWFIGEWLDKDPYNGSDVVFSAEQRHNAETAHIGNDLSVRNNVKKYDLPKNSRVKDACDAAREVLRDIRAANRMLKEEIPEYNLGYDARSGRLTINEEYELALVNEKAAAGEVAAEIVSHANSGPFEPKYKKTNQSLGTIINQGLHIRGVVKQVFLKGSRKSVLRSRSPVSRKTLEDEGVDLFDLDLELLKAGVKTVPKTK